MATRYLRKRGTMELFVYTHALMLRGDMVPYNGKADKGKAADAGVDELARLEKVSNQEMEKAMAEANEAQGNAPPSLSQAETEQSSAEESTAEAAKVDFKNDSKEKLIVYAMDAYGETLDPDMSRGEVVATLKKFKKERGF